MVCGDQPWARNILAHGAPGNVGSGQDPACSVGLDQRSLEVGREQLPERLTMIVLGGEGGN